MRYRLTVALDLIAHGAALRDDEVTPAAAQALRRCPEVTCEIHRSGYYFRSTDALDQRWASKGSRSILDSTRRSHQH